MNIEPMPMTKYPAHWWQPIDDPQKPDWEILPQQCTDPKKVILSKRNELGVLSNFAHTPFMLDGVKYQSIEGFWQMMFYPESKHDPRAMAQNISWPNTREQVSQMVSHAAWAAGDIGYKNMLVMGINHVTYQGQMLEYWTDQQGPHYALIIRAMREKLKQNSKVRDVLVSTGDLILLADHYEPVDAPPSWKYYKIWMLLRDELRQGLIEFTF
jgi:predicted NAD-dependent protein-ADP-ribosyltransferase YbiA (DUF1768 family)